MALWLHRLFASSCFRGNFCTSSRLSIMLQCRGVQHYPGFWKLYSSYLTGAKHGNVAQLQFKKPGETCTLITKQLKDLSFMVERGSCFLRSSNNEYGNSGATFKVLLHASLPYAIKNRSIFTTSCLESKVKFVSSSMECASRRFFSVEATQKSQSPGNLMKPKEKVVGKNGGRNSFFRGAKRFQNKIETTAVRGSSSDGCSQVAVSTQPVNKTVSDTSNPVSTNLQRLKSKEQSVGAGKESESFASAVAKCSSNKPETKAEGKRKHQKNKKKLLSTLAAPSGDGNAEVFKQASHEKNSSVTKAGQTSPASEILPTGGTPVPTSKSALTNSGSKQTNKSSKKKKPQKEVTVHTKPNAPTQPGSSAVAVEVDRRPKQRNRSSKKKKPQKEDTVHMKPKAPAKHPGAALSVEVNRGPKQMDTSSKNKEPQKEVTVQTKPKSPTELNNPAEVNRGPKQKDQSSKKKKSQNEVTDHPKPKAPTKHNSPAVPIEVNREPRGSTLRPLYPPIGKSVLVVESPTKAKIIQGYLGNMFEVLPSYGHVRDLAGRSGSVRPDDNFSVVWEVPTPAWKVLKSIKGALNGAKNLILASDPDREGEAIAWHIMEMLQQQEVLHANITVARVVFHEITESSIKSALQAPRDIDLNLVHAYLARRALDYLIGFSISPLLWKKLPACQSAGRVQSVALSLVCDREMEIDEFKPQEYWTVEVHFKQKGPQSLKTTSLPSRLSHCGSKQLQQLSITSHGEAQDIEQKITSSSFVVIGSKRSKARTKPPPPYITSTLQQDAAHKFQFPTSKTMSLAQKLYEGVELSDGEATGLITYMRTDGVHISDVAAKDIHSLVIQRYGRDFAPESTRKYFKKANNAQEAHEAIRPTNIRRLPSMLTEVLDGDSLKLYTLIWSRTMACQMEPSVVDKIQVDIGDAENSLVFRSTCSRAEFLGYQKVYKDLEVALVGNNEKEGDAHGEVFKFLSTVKVGDSLQLEKVELVENSTQPPPRYSEASLVKKLEELGIGRPSTYASIIKVLVDRQYLTINRVLYPEFRGRMVSAFLSHHFSEVTNYSFTANMETELDNVSAGKTEWKRLLTNYWTRFSKYCENAGNVDVRQVEKMLEKRFSNYLFTSLPDKSRTCPSCSDGTLIFKISRVGVGYHIGCDQHPRCKYMAKTMYCDDEEEESTEKKELFGEPKLLGLHPGSSEKIIVKNGPYGFYIQLGEDRKGYMPKRASLSQVKDVEAITLEDALDLLRYPVILGDHPDDGEPVYLRLAKHGYSIRHRRTIAPVPQSTDVKKITVADALQFLLSKDATHCGRPKNKKRSEDDIIEY